MGVENGIKAIIIDDEVGACENLRILLEKYCPFIEVLSYAHNTKEAERVISEYEPELVFLDIEMPNETGIDFIKRIWPVNFEIVFVTAYDEYAIKTFRLNALDYILKPISIDYLKDSMQRVQDLFETFDRNRDADLRLEAYKDEQEKENIILRNNGCYQSVPFKAILYLKAEGAYTSFIIREQDKSKSCKIVTTYNLASYDDILPPNFLRCHRSFVVNMDNIDGVRQDKDEKKILFPEIEIPISRRRYPLIKAYLK